MIQFYNSLTRKPESFEPFDKKTVRMYSCGPTVYDFAHIGNFRSIFVRFFSRICFDVSWKRPATKSST